MLGFARMGPQEGRAAMSETRFPGHFPRLFVFRFLGRFLRRFAGRFPGRPPFVAGLFALILAPGGALALAETAPLSDCDRLAGFRALPRLPDAPGVYAIRYPDAAVAACEEARRASPGDPFLSVLLARARVAAKPEDSSVLELLDTATEAFPALVAAEIGRLYETGRAGLPTGDRQARGFYRQACDLAPDPLSRPGCTRLGVMMIEGRGGPTDLETGFRLLGALCGEGWGAACTQLAFQTDLRGIGDFDTLPERIAALFEAGCAAGDLLGCSQLGFRLELGDGVAHDPARAQALYRDACDGGEPQGCSYLGEIYRSGLGVPPDMVEATRLFAMGCDGNDPYACVTLGDILSDGRGVPVDLRRALSVLEHACWLGDPEGCDKADELR